MDDRSVPGHSQGDLLCDSQIATLVERQTRDVMLVKIASKDSETVVNALIKHAGKLPQELYISRPPGIGERRWRATSSSRWPRTSPCTSPIRNTPWQRGSNENANSLLTQYFPKGIDLSVYSQAKLNAVARRLNEPPRKTPDYEAQPNDFIKLLHRPVESALFNDRTVTTRRSSDPFAGIAQSG